MTLPDSYVQRFLFEGLDIRGALVHLNKQWQSMQVDREYPDIVTRLLGETMAVTALIADQMKQSGSRLTLQLRGQGPIELLVLDCNDQLQMRGMARCQADIHDAPVPELLGAERGGQLMLSLELPDARHPYQSFVPMTGDTIAAIFEHFLAQSAQQPSCLITAADETQAACLFLQKMPQADEKDPDGWSRITQLAQTVTPEELKTLDGTALLSRLFHEETLAAGIRLYEAQPVTHHCPENRSKIADMILGLGKEEAMSIIEAEGDIVVRDDICNRTYRFERTEVEALFSALSQEKMH